MLVYSGFTGLSGFSQSWIDFTIYRFLVGLGVGGMFGAATTLVAESVPGQLRAVALGALQALSAMGNIIGSLISLQIQPGATTCSWGYSGWRVLFFVGILPSLLVVPIVFVLREPEPWRRAKEAAKAGAIRRTSVRRSSCSGPHAGGATRIVGLMLGVSGMIGLWGIGFFSPELISTALAGAPQTDDRHRARLGHGAPGRRRVPRHGDLHRRRVAASAGGWRSSSRSWPACSSRCSSSTR